MNANNYIHLQTGLGRQRRNQIVRQVTGDTISQNNLSM